MSCPICGLDDCETNRESHFKHLRAMNKPSYWLQYTDTTINCDACGTQLGWVMENDLNGNKFCCNSCKVGVGSL